MIFIVSIANVKDHHTKRDWQSQYALYNTKNVSLSGEVGTHSSVYYNLIELLLKQIV